MKTNKLTEKDLARISLDNLISYLNLNGWKKTDPSNDKIIIFEGPKDDNGRPLEIILPSSDEYQDYYRRISEAINILAVIEGENKKNIINKISSIHHDVLKFRIISNDKNFDSISLKKAQEKIQALKELFMYGACSEKEEKPHFDRPLSIGKNYAEACQFGHTFKGSFGFTISSPLEDQTSFSFKEENIETTPFERRVTERIIRGLNLMKKSVKEDDADIMVNNFDIGFSSRMCESFLKISDERTKKIGLSVFWDPIIEVSNDIKTQKEFQLDEASYEVLDYAAKELKKVKPFETTIIGKIITLHSNRAPMKEENFNRTATIKTEYNGDKINVKLYLNREQYKIAYEAHGEGAPIKISGELFKEGTTWKAEEIKQISIYYE